MFPLLLERLPIPVKDDNDPIVATQINIEDGDYSIGSGDFKNL